MSEFNRNKSGLDHKFYYGNLWRANLIQNHGGKAVTTLFTTSLARSRVVSYIPLATVLLTEAKNGKNYHNSPNFENSKLINIEEAPGQ